ncbi:hypothetical protein PILCRDRAFT_814082 [Piloderma croceum F 1598]|uniref:Restriction of telomere capping protein 4 n=1 Tax=Piloderma croceum (strain F 1598) TaxID=765440 RepID=A0A0C3GBZ4_PILCF|nr:hypothetical protein PILCRDRAFT_814082 [Piloderma croceum F 1598]
MGKLSQNGTTLFDDKSYRLRTRPLSQPQPQPQPSKREQLAQVPGRGQGFDDIGSSFGSKKPKRAPTRVRTDSGSLDEIDILPSTHSSDDAKRVHKAKAASKSKGKEKAKVADEEGVVINGKFLPYHEDHKPKSKLPKINKIKNPTSTDNTDTPSQPKSNYASRPTTFLGSSSNPIRIAVEPKSKPNSKVLAAASSRTRPLHDRSPNRPSQATTSRPLPRPAYRGAKNASSPDLDEPTKAKGKGKMRKFPMDGVSPVADKRVEKSSSFPCISPLASPKHKRQQFPNLSPLSSPAKAKIVDSDAEKDDEDDELGMDSGDDILTRGAPRPFPMSTQMLQSIQRTKKRLSGGVGENGTRGNGRTDDEDEDVFMAPLNYADISQFEDSLFLDPSIDPSTLCPYCDEPLPQTPTPHLVGLLESTLKKSYPDPRPTNPQGRKAPLAAFIAVCQRHRFESVKLPEAERKKWPLVIKFEEVRRRVERMKDSLEAIILDKDENGWDSDSDEDGTDEEKEKGPRGKSVFWKEIVKEVKKKGSRAVVGVSGQFASFEKTQPGYYGELGSVIIHQTLYGLFPPSSFDPTLIAPLTPPEFIQRILVPEAAVGLILEDRRLNPQNEKHKEKAVKILRESAAYGVAMFPDADTNVGASGKGRKDEEDWVMGVGDEIVRERARMRRKELEEEERAEEMRIKNETERVKREGGGNKMQKRKENKLKEKHKSNEQEVVEISESSDAGRPKPKPRKVQRATNPIKTNEVGHASDTSQATNGRTTTVRKKTGGSSKSRQKSADINLCSSTSDDTTGRALRRETKGKRKATESEASADSMNLVYPSSDDMSVDGSDTLVYPSPPPPLAQPLKANNSIVSLLSEDEETPRSKKVPPKSSRAKAPISNASSGAPSNTKSSFPLQIARNRQFEARHATEEGGWKRHISPLQPSGIDDDGNASDDSCSSIRDYLNTPSQRQKNEHSWLLSQSSTTSTGST